MTVPLRIRNRAVEALTEVEFNLVLLSQQLGDPDGDELAQMAKVATRMQARLHHIWKQHTERQAPGSE